MNEDNGWLKDIIFALVLGVPLGYIFFTYGITYFLIATVLVIVLGVGYFFATRRR